MTSEMVAAVSSRAVEPHNTAAPGWYPDPTHRFEFRYYNGERWTADVARFSNRYIDPLDASTSVGTTAPKRGMAITALVFSLCSLFLAWIPFLFVVGAAGALTALILGTIVLRRSAAQAKSGKPVASGHGMAVAAMCVSVGALALCVIGFQLTRVVLEEVDELFNPGPYETEISSCERNVQFVQAAGSIRNLDDETHSYRLTIAFYADDLRLQTRDVRANDVAPGEIHDFSVTSSAVDDEYIDVTCEVDSVRGPEPFSD